MTDDIDTIIEQRVAAALEVHVAEHHGAHNHDGRYALTSHSHGPTNEDPGDEEPTDPPGEEPGPSPSGQAMPTTDPAGWVRTFEDDFLTPVAEGEGNFEAAYPNWGRYPKEWTDTSRNAGRPSAQQGYYGTRVVSVHDGMLDVHCRQVDGKWRVAALQPKPEGGSGKTSHRIAVRFKADPVFGFKTAWLTWPTSETWPRDGEIDYPEGDLNGTISAFMHRQGATSGSDQDVRNTSARYTDWHTAVIEWEAGQRCAFYMDGQLLGSAITSRVPNTPHRYVLQTETRISSTPPPSGAQAHVLLDWIVMWTKP